MPTRLGLLARVTFIYALGALLLSTAVALATFTLAQRNLISSFEQSATRQVFNNARFLQQGLDRLPTPEQIAESLAEAAESDVEQSATPEATPDPTGQVLDDLFLPNGADPLFIRSDGHNYSYGLESRAIPNQLREQVLLSGSGEMRYTDAADDVVYGIGLTLHTHDVTYYEVTKMGDLNETLNSLRVILIGVSISASLAGALLGYYSARRALQPVSRIAAAAEAIADGDFEARLDPTVDPDLARLTSSFNEMVDALGARIERDERFASDVSHELRSPLMTLAASVEVLERRRDDLPEPAQQAVTLLGKDIQRFQGLVEDLLEISRLDVGAATLDLSPLVLMQFLSAVVAHSRTPEVAISPDPRFPELLIVADKRRLAQVLSNLLDNARKYGGGATSVSYRQVGMKVQITVEDAGRGIPPEERTKIFDRFTRSKQDAGRRDVAMGVGLGLSLVLEHIRLHEGQVWVTDRLDGRDGARFVVEIPVGDIEDLDEEMAV